VVFGGGPGFADRVADQFRLLGWDVCTAATADELHRKVARKNPAAVVLPAAAACESGFLTAAKLRLTRPRLRVVLVGEPTGQARRLAGFVGAGFATEETAADAVLKLI
jgi:DNA-binding response OmpR family regulator